MSSPEAYYNEHDPHAAQWLRNLIAGGHLPPGVVDERDIRDVAPAQLFRFTQCHFFAGIGVWPLAFRRAGWPDDRPLWTGSSPCQPFSAAGKGEGFDDERHLWPHWHWLIQIIRPDVVAGEQVAGADGLGWYDLVSDDLAGIGYASGAVNISAAGFGVGWRGSAESERLEWAIRSCPDPMVARHMASFAEWADQALAIGGFHIRQRLYFVGLADGDGDGRQFVAQRDGEPAGRGGVQDGHHDDGCGDPSGMADAAGGGSGPRLCDRGPAEQRGVFASDDSGDDGLVDGQRAGSQGQRRDGDGSDQSRRIEPDSPRSASAAGDAGGLDNGLGVGRGARRDGDHARHVGIEPSADGGDGIGMGNPDGGDSSPERKQASGEHGLSTPHRTSSGQGRGGGLDPRSAELGAVPSGGQRGSVDWLFCRDGVWRPAEPGTFPLAHAAPARVGRLRAYGNGLDLETATHFATVLIEILKETGRW